MKNICRASAVIVAAGTGSRMKSNINKQYLMLSDKPVLAHTIDVFEKSEFISEIVVVIHEDDMELFENRIMKPFGYSKIKAAVKGGYDRQASVYNGLREVGAGTGIVAIHDGARPLVTSDIINESIISASQTGAACVGVPVKDTIKKADSNHIVEKTMDRTLLWSIQTPQTFKKDILLRAHERAILEGFRGTDDSVLAERLGIPVKMVMGSYSNIKITTREDLILAEAFLSAMG